MGLVSQQPSESESELCCCRLRLGFIFPRHTGHHPAQPIRGQLSESGPPHWPSKTVESMTAGPDVFVGNQ